jgi:glycosyltransferase involved in cell wall biosynthesis
VRHRLLDVEITEALPDITLDADEGGVGVVVRHHGRPVGFVLEALRPGARLSAARLDRLVGRTDAIGVVRAALGHELVRPAPDGGPGPTFTVAVCTKDRPERLARCLDSILASVAADTAAADRAAVEVLVVDNAPSDDATRDLVAGRPGVRYAREAAAGLDFARNRALAEATGDVVAYVDDDVVVERAYVAALRAAWRDDPDAGGVTGLVLPFELATDAQVRFELRGGFRRGFHRIRWQGDRLDGNPVYPFGAGMFGAGCNMAFRRRLLLELGGFDEALDTGRPLPGGGDIDMFFRVLRSGAPLVYAPAVVVRHEHRREYEALRHQYHTWGTGSMAFLAKWYARGSADDRRTIRRLLAWWFGRYQPGMLARGLLGRRGMTLGLALAELGGGLLGLAGEYGRSRRRSARIAAAARTADGGGAPAVAGAVAAGATAVPAGADGRHP